jgi:hypothetical protein
MNIMTHFDNDEYDRPILKITEEPVVLRIISEEFEIPSKKYGPRRYRNVALVGAGTYWKVFTSARTFAAQLAALEEECGGDLIGIAIVVRRESADQLAGYIVERW